MNRNDHAKRSFYKAVNSIFARVASEEVTVYGW